jgi:hypothetical protein
MKRVRLLRSFRSYKKGEVVVLTADLAGLLIERGMAVAEQQADLLQGFRSEAAIVSPEVRRATLSR